MCVCVCVFERVCVYVGEEEHGLSHAAQTHLTHVELVGAHL